MPNITAPIKLGADCFGQRVEWTDYLAAMELAGYVEVGYHHIIAGLLAPYDEETMTRFATEVRPRLEAMAA